MGTTLKWSRHSFLGSCPFVYILLLMSSLIIPLSGIVRHTALIGAKVTLACNVTPSILNDSLNIVLWYKDDAEQPLYSLDARQLLNKTIPVNHVVHDAVRGRAFFNMISDLAFLEISDVNEEDGGIYTCRVDFRRSRTILYQVELFVIVPPPKPIITDHRVGKTVEGIIGPYNEGESLALRCTVNGGNPSPDVIWLKGGYVYSRQFIRAPDGIVYNDLLINEVSRKLLNENLVCQASNNNITVPSKARVKPDINLYPLKTMIVTPQRPMRALRKVRLTCKTSGSRPAAVITWYKQGRQLKRVKSEISADNKTTVSVLTLIPAESDNAKILKCVAKNPILSGRVVDDTWKLNIVYIPRVSARLGSGFNASNIIEGGTVYIECYVDANPKAVHFDWYFNNMNLATNNASSIVVVNRTLILKQLTPYHKGNYTCGAVNRIGQGESNPVKLDVKHAPVCKLHLRTTLYASKDESVKVHCSVIADPERVAFKWWFRSSHTKEKSTVSFKSEGKSSVATHHILTDDDFGELYCWAKNSIGDQHDPCVFHIVYANVPEAVKNCTYIENKNLLFVRCEKGQDGGLPQTFIMEVLLEKTNELYANISAFGEPRFQLDINPKVDDLLVRVYAVNDKGRSSHCSLVVQSLIGNRKLFGIANLSFLSPITGGIICGVVILILTAAVVLILMIKKRRRQQERRRELYKKSQIAQICADDFSEQEKKSPDIIPPASGLQDSMEHRNMLEASEVISKKVSFQEDPEITFVELDLPPFKQQYIRRDNFSAEDSNKWIKSESIDSVDVLMNHRSPRTFSESEV